ncbi:MAG TPA: M28 family peptidase [Candidatus Thermoplasmatota archaeon]|nr:M28 family peptidase [Candidatus Thermoplasmatota archaeon]
MRAFLAATFLAALMVLVPAAAAQSMYDMPSEVLEWAITDGTPLELDPPDMLAALAHVQEEVSGQRIHDCVADITQGVPPSYRLMGTPTQEMFLDEHGSVFSDLGLKSARHEFTEGGPGIGPTPDLEQLQGGVNLLGVLPGRDLTKWVVMGGHYDTREFTLGGGALDNAAGICTVAELARAYKAHADAHGPLEASVVFVWYDGEEWGLYGAVAFSKDTSVAKELLGLDQSVEPDILVSQSYDMPGINYPAKNTWVDYGDPLVTDEYAVLNLRTAPIHDEVEWTCWSYGCYEDLKAHPDFAQIKRDNANFQFLMREVAYDVLELPPQYVWVYDDHYGRSDHIPLIGLGSAGNRIQGSHDKEYPHYHQPTDSLPGIYAITGGTPAGIVAGLETEAEAGGLTAFYVAETGGFGHYGDKLFLGEDVHPEAGAGAGSSDEGSQDSPGLAPAMLLLALAAVAAVLRRR